MKKRNIEKTLKKYENMKNSNMWRIPNEKKQTNKTKKKNMKKILNQKENMKKANMRKLLKQKKNRKKNE